MAEPIPPVDYSSRDWLALRTDLIAAARSRMPEWTSDSPNDFGVVLIELFAYVGDMLSFYADRVANEAYLGTAVLRSSVLAIARMLDYRPTGLGAATLTMQFTATGPAFIPAGTQVQTVAAADDLPIIFETAADLTIAAAGNGVVTAVQGMTIHDEIVGVANGSLDQAYAMFRSPLIDGTTVVRVDEGSGAFQWTFFDHLIDAGPNDAAYTVAVDEGGIAWVLFGDNVNGRAPMNGAEVTVTYRVGAGAAGNVGIGAVVQLTGPVIQSGIVQPLSAVSNTTVGSGGADPETLNSIRANAPKSLSTINRAVTTDDYEALALRVSGVGKASASAAVSTAVNLYLAPSNAPSGTCSMAVKTAVLAYLNTRKMIGTAITLLDPQYLSINVTAAINVMPAYRQEAVRQAVITAIKTVLAYDVVDFGTRVSLSKVYRAINATEGVDYGNVTVLSTTPTGLADVLATAAQIPQAGTITVTATGGVV
jgi:hypothetical protein